MRRSFVRSRVIASIHARQPVLLRDPARTEHARFTVSGALLNPYFFRRHETIGIIPSRLFRISIPVNLILHRKKPRPEGCSTQSLVYATFRQTEAGSFLSCGKQAAVASARRESHTRRRSFSTEHCFRWTAAKHKVTAQRRLTLLPLPHPNARNLGSI
jgi:hypothetical protein